jgi:hypothetical protein
MLVSTTLYEVRIYVLPSYQSQSPQRLPRVPTHPHQRARLGKKEEGAAWAWRDVGAGREGDRRLPPA